MLSLLLLIAALIQCSTALVSDEVVESNIASLPMSINKLFDFIGRQYDVTYQQWQNSGQINYPSFGLSDETAWSTDTVKDGSWTAGFMPGVLWNLAKHYGINQSTSPSTDTSVSQYWIDRATNATWGVESMAYNTQTHDVGFVIMSSFHNAYTVTNDSRFLATIKIAANSLSSRFSPVVGCTRSWNSATGFLVIIDNMINLELLFAGAIYSHNDTLRQQAVSHANRTLVNHFRPANYSTYHVVEYSESDGSVLNKYSAQGYASWSTWSRGQAWAIYGYTMCYRHARDQSQFLQQAIRAAKLWIDTAFHDDLFNPVPFWDFNAPRINVDGKRVYQPKDTSAAAVAASAFLELSHYVDDVQMSEILFNCSIKLLSSLVNVHMNYQNKFGRLPGVLNNATAGPYHEGDPSHPYDAFMMYGEYYFTEALFRLETYVEDRDRIKLETKMKRSVDKKQSILRDE